MKWRKFAIDTLIMNIFWLPPTLFYYYFIVQVTLNQLIYVALGSIAFDTSLAGLYHRFYDDMFYQLYTKRKRIKMIKRIDKIIDNE